MPNLVREASFCVVPTLWKLKGNIPSCLENIKYVKTAEIPQLINMFEAVDERLYAYSQQMARSSSRRPSATSGVSGSATPGPSDRRTSSASLHGDRGLTPAPASRRGSLTPFQSRASLSDLLNSPGFIPYYDSATGATFTSIPYLECPSAFEEIDIFDNRPLTPVPEDRAIPQTTTAPSSRRPSIFHDGVPDDHWIFHFLEPCQDPEEEIILSSSSRYNTPQPRDVTPAPNYPSSSTRGREPSIISISSESSFASDTDSTVTAIHPYRSRSNTPAYSRHTTPTPAPTPVREPTPTPPRRNPARSRAPPSRFEMEYDPRPRSPTKSPRKPRAATSVAPVASTSSSSPYAYPMSSSSAAEPAPIPMIDSTGQTVYRCPMPGCSHTVARSGDIKRHLKSSAHTEASHKCPACNMVYMREGILRRHLQECARYRGMLGQGGKR